MDKTLQDAAFEMEVRDFTGDNISLTVYKGEARLCIEEPWAGDTESGFGRECSAYLNRDQLAALRDAINGALGEPPSTPIEQ